MITILCLALLGQPPTSGGDPARVNLELMRGVEEFVIAARPDARPPDPFAGLISRLGGRYWRDREAATATLESASRGDQRWLFWGRVHPDIEVRLRCNAILRRLNPCGACKGEGQSKAWEAWPCWDCQGTKTAWPWSMWD